MRLTLRTLLAYMDDILEPADQEELSQKIESSEFATDLVHRTRDTIRRLRLSAPQPLGSGLGLDPNTVAEYLDNTLTPDNVADLERICLESDVHLAEVAACHHVLTMVLGEPAEIDPKVRQRAYTIAGELESQKQALAGASVASGDAAMSVEGAAALAAESDVVPAASAASSQIFEVPDYLRASRWSPVAMGAGLLAVAAGIAVMVYLGQWMFAGPSADDLIARRDAQASEAPAGVDRETDADVVEEATSASTPVTSADGEAEQPSDTGTSPTTTEASPPPVVVPTDPLPVTPIPDTQPAEAVTPPATGQEGPISPPPGDVATGAGDASTGTEGERATVDAGDATLREAPIPPPVEDVADTPSDSMESESDVHEPADAAVQPSGEPPPSTELGTYWADRNVLLRYDPASSQWYPLATGSTIHVADRLLSLPTFRPTVALRSGMGAKLVGAASIELFGQVEGARPPDPTAESAPTMVITYGHVVLINSGDEGNPIHVVMGNSAGTIRLGAGAVAAFHVVRNWVPGTDPLTTPSPVEATAYAPQGNATWIVEGQSYAAEGPSQWEIAATEPVRIEPLSDDISWLEGETLDRLERSAAEHILERLDPQRPASPVLLDVSNSRRREWRALGTRCAAYVGEFAPFVKALYDSDQRSAWDLHIETLREALALSPESAAKVQRALFEQRGDEAATDMFEMLCGYSLEDIGMTDEERQTGALDRLINFLESDNVEYRVLANYNLREITGKNLLPNPTADPDERARGVRRWRQRLQDGELEPLPTYGW